MGTGWNDFQRTELSLTAMILEFHLLILSDLIAQVLDPADKEIARESLGGKLQIRTRDDECRASIVVSKHSRC